MKEHDCLIEKTKYMLNIFNRGLPEDSIGARVCNETIEAINQITQGVGE